MIECHTFTEKNAMEGFPIETVLKYFSFGKDPLIYSYSEQERWKSEDTGECYRPLKLFVVSHGVIKDVTFEVASHLQLEVSESPYAILLTEERGVGSVVRALSLSLYDDAKKIKSVSLNRQQGY